MYFIAINIRKFEDTKWVIRSCSLKRDMVQWPKKRPKHKQWSTKYYTKKRPKDKQWSTKYYTKKRPKHKQWSTKYYTKKRPKDKQWSTKYYTDKTTHCDDLSK